MKKKCGFLIFLIVIMVSIIFLPRSVYADDISEQLGGGNTTSRSSNTTGNSSSSSSSSSTTYNGDLGDLNQCKGTEMSSSKLVHIGEVVVSGIRVIGIVLSVVILMIIGLKYMLGSVEEKADYKQTLVPYIVGAFILFTGSLIPELIYKIMQNF